MNTLTDPVPPQFERTHILLGDAELGGVGSYCAEALARAGIGRLTLIDHDSVAISNINRQLPALLSTIDQPKVEFMAARVRDINPECDLTIIREFILPESVFSQIPPDADYLIDCIDSLNCKVALVEHGVKTGIPVASSMGAGNRLNPAHIKLADISKTRGCPLASIMRKRIKRRGISKGVLTVFTDERPRAPRPPEPVTGRGRPRAVNGTISYMPPLFGLMLAGEVIRRLLEKT